MRKRVQGVMNHDVLKQLDLNRDVILPAAPKPVVARARNSLVQAGALLKLQLRRAKM